MKQPKAFLCDFLGTIVDWRYSLTRQLHDAATKAVEQGGRDSAAVGVASRMTWTHWEAFTVEWHSMYLRFSAGFVPGVSDWVSNDEVNLRSLRVLIKKRNLAELWTDAELKEIGLFWHKLDPWPDCKRGIELLGKVGVTSTLSNGSRALLASSMKKNGVPFHKLLCSDDFLLYKPAPEVYTGAVQKVLARETDGPKDGGDARPEDVALVAAHLEDLQAAKRNGLMTIYVERPMEEALPTHKISEIKAQGHWVDMWIEDGQGGIEEVARRLGIQ